MGAETKWQINLIICENISSSALGKSLKNEKRVSKLFFDEMEGWKEFNRGSKISKGMNYGNRKSLLFQNSVKWCPRKLKRVLGKGNLTVLKCFEFFFHNLASTICYVHAVKSN